MTQNIRARSINYKQARLALAIAFSIIAAAALVEAVGGVQGNSLALLSNAGHKLVVALSLGMSFIALRIASSPQTIRKTYSHKLGVLVVLAGGILFILVSFYIFHATYIRLTGAPRIRESLVLLVGGAGLVANLAAIYALHGVRKNDSNVKRAFTHVLLNIASLGGVIAATFTVSLAGLAAGDSLISLLIGGLILSGAIGLVEDSKKTMPRAIPRRSGKRQRFR